MKRKFTSITLIIALFWPNYSRADLFGGDVAVLVQILANAVQQLAQLKSIMDNGKDTLGLMQDINRGINDSLQLMKTAGLITDPGVYKEWTEVQTALGAMESIYGIAVSSQEQRSQMDADRGVAEAVTLGNSVYQYTNEVDELAETIKQFSHDVSPGGAQKLTAQSMGVLLHVMNQGLRIQSTGMKLQAQHLALENKKDKASTAVFLSTAKSLAVEMKKPREFYKTPRF